MQVIVRVGIRAKEDISHLHTSKFKRYDREAQQWSQRKQQLPADINRQTTEDLTLQNGAGGCS